MIYSKFCTGNFSRTMNCQLLLIEVALVFCNRYAVRFWNIKFKGSLHFPPIALDDVPGIAILDMRSKTFHVCYFIYSNICRNILFSHHLKKVLIILKSKDNTSDRIAQYGCFCSSVNANFIKLGFPHEILWQILEYLEYAEKIFAFLNKEKYEFFGCFYFIILFVLIWLKS